jgi:hypothetical protein
MFEKMEDLIGRKKKTRKEQIVECSLICVGVAVGLGIMVLALILL